MALTGDALSVRKDAGVERRRGGEQTLSGKGLEADFTLVVLPRQQTSYSTVSGALPVSEKCNAGVHHALVSHLELAKPSYKILKYIFYQSHGTASLYLYLMPLSS